MPRMFKTALIFFIFMLLPLRFAWSATTVLSHFDTLANWTESDSNIYFIPASFSVVGTDFGVVPSDPSNMGKVECSDCNNVTLTWQPASPVAVTGSYLGIDAYSYNQDTDGHMMIVTSDTGTSVTLAVNNTSCNVNVSGGSCEPDGILSSDMWETLFVPLNGITSIAKVQIILAMSNTVDTTIYVDWLRDFTSIPVCQNAAHLCTPVPTPTFTNTISPTNTFSPSPTFTKTSTPTNTPTPSMTGTPTNTPTSSFTSTNTATPTSTATPTNTPTNTQTSTITNTFSPTSTFTSSLTPTTTSTETMTRTFTGTPTPSFTSTDTPQFTTTHTDTFTNTPTSTSTSTPTGTSTSTNTFTATVTSTNTITSTPTDTPLFTYTITNTSTSTPTWTSTVTSTATPTNTASSTSTFTWTVTPSNTATVTNTATPTSTFTWTNTRTITFTPTITNTPPPPTNTPTVTATPWPLWVFPNPIDFQQTGADTSNQTIDYDCHLGPGSPLFGCVKFNGVEKGSTLKIYTVALTHVRTFRANDGYPMVPGSLNPNVVQITWDGTNEDRNPVAAGIYFYVMDGGPSGKHIGKLAIKGARK